MTELVWGLPGVDTDRATNKKKSRCVSYSGCWTCRERRIKCDERPVSCNNCHRANRVCGGYDVRLVWATNAHGKPVKPLGRRRNATWREGSSMVKEHEKNENRKSTNRSSAIEASSVTCLPPLVLLCGPPDSSALGFAALDDPSRIERTETMLQTEELDIEFDKISSPNQHLASLSRSSASSAWNHETTLGNLHDLVQSFVQPLGTERAVEASFVSSQNDTCVPWTDFGINLEPVLAHDAAWDSSNVSPALIPIEASPASNDDSNTSRADSCLILSSSTSSSPLELIPSLDQEVSLREPPSTILLREFSERLCYLMQPVSHRDNPFKNIYFMTALDGHRYLDTAQAQTQLSLASVSVYHSVLAAAAIDIRGRFLSAASYAYVEKIAFFHRTKALEAARGALVGKIRNYRQILTAMLCLVSVDIVDGGIQDHWIHLEAATRLQKSRQRLKLVGRQTLQLNTICSMLNLFAQTALNKPDPRPWKDYISILDDSTLDGSSSCVEFIYGTTPTITRAIFKIFRLSQSIAFYQDKPLPDALLEACEDLHDELLSWRIESESFSTIDTTDASMLELARAQTTAFYNSTLIYYYRSIQNCTRTGLQKEQQEVLRAMNLVEDLKSSLPGRTQSAAPVTWPAFIASCEAVGQGRDAWARWWDRVKCYRMVNYVKQKSIIDSIWVRIENEDDLIDWREILSSMMVRVIPV